MSEVNWKGRFDEETSPNAKIDDKKLKIKGTFIRFFVSLQEEVTKKAKKMDDRVKIRVSEYLGDFEKKFSNFLSKNLENQIDKFRTLINYKSLGCNSTPSIVNNKFKRPPRLLKKSTSAEIISLRYHNDGRYQSLTGHRQSSQPDLSKQIKNFEKSEKLSSTNVNQSTIHDFNPLFPSPVASPIPEKQKSWKKSSEEKSISNRFFDLKSMSDQFSGQNLTNFPEKFQRKIFEELDDSIRIDLRSITRVKHGLKRKYWRY